MKIKHEGLHTNRLTKAADNPREVVFAKQWAKVNETRTGIPFSTLQYLLGDGTFEGAAYPTQDQATIAATVVQWLGSNVGMSFLEESLKKCGYKIVKEKGSAGPCAGNRD